MRCPYCAEDILDEAMVCPYCRHDLAPSKHLIDENKRLGKEVETLQAEIKGLRAQNARALADAQAIARRKQAPLQAIVRELLNYALVPIVLLLFAHFLIIIVWDKSTIYLRIVSIVIPMAFGFALIRRERRSIALAIVIGAAVSLLAIFGMSLAVAIRDQVPILPSNAQEWNEDIQYFTSMALAFIAGGLLGRLTHSPQQLVVGPNRTVKWVAKVTPLLSPKRSLARGKKAKTIQMIERALGMQQLVTGIVAAATTVASIYTGLMSVLH